jgi:hypothetical protein
MEVGALGRGAMEVLGEGDGGTRTGGTAGREERVGSSSRWTRVERVGEETLLFLL